MALNHGSLYVFSIVPGPVSNLGLNNVYDTSVQVSWEQPQEVNGALSGKNSIQFN